MKSLRKIKSPAALATLGGVLRAGAVRRVPRVGGRGLVVLPQVVRRLSACASRLRAHSRVPRRAGPQLVAGMLPRGRRRLRAVTDRPAAFAG